MYTETGRKLHEVSEVLRKGEPESLLQTGRPPTFRKGGSVMEANDKKMVSIQIREDLQERLVAYAQEKGKTPEEILERLVENALRDDQIGEEKFYG